ncbi:MAG: Transketolase [Ignavibacteria bacterium]|nr:Transketolase [Ignavibacteria bacterium]
MDLGFFPTLTFENRKRNAKELAEIALVIRRDIINSLVLAKSGHSGGPLGISDFMASLFFGGYMKYNPQDATWAERDRFVFSAGHYCPVQYSCLARAGYFPVEELATLRKFGSRLQGHPGREVKLPGIETSSGSLGQGISIAVGMAISDNLIDKNNRKVFAVTGDGELQEGSCWEAAMSAAQFKLDNLCWIVDNNDCQIDGRVRDVMSIYPIAQKFEAFGFDAITIDGHNFEQIFEALDMFVSNHANKIRKPTVIILQTKMGRGVSFMEDNYEWHGKPPTPAEAEIALEQLI